MGRFYKTSSPKLIDYSFKLPEELMIKTVQFQDRMITAEQQSLDNYLKSLRGQGLGSEDESRLKEIFSGFKGNIDDVTNNLNENVLEWRQMMPKIQKLGKDIYYESTEGEWAAIQGNFNAYQQWSKDIDELSKKNPDKFRPQDIQKLKQYAYVTWEGTNYDKESGKYKGFSGMAPAEYTDLTQYVNELGKGWQSDAGKTYRVDKQGNYWVKSQSGWEAVDEKEVYDAMMNSLANNSKVRDYYQQRFIVDTKLGYLNESQIDQMASNIPGLENADPFTKYFVSTINSAATFAAKKYGFVKKESGITGVTADKFALEDSRYEHQRQLKEMEMGISKVIFGTTQTVQVLDPKEFNHETVAKQISEINTNVKTTTKEIATLQSELDKLDPNSQEAVAKQVQIKELEAQLVGYNDKLQRLTNFEQSSDNYSDQQLLKKGWSKQNVEFYNLLNEKLREQGVTLDKAIEDANSSYQAYTLTVGGSDPFVSYDKFKKRMEKKGYSESMIQTLYQMKSNGSLKQYSKLDDDKKTFKNDWYSTNSDKNAFSYNALDVTQPLTTDPTGVNLLRTTLFDDSNIYTNDNLFAESEGDYTTGGKNTKGLNRFVTKKSVRFKEIEQMTGKPIESFITDIKATPGKSGTRYWVQFDTKALREAGVKLKTQEGEPGVISFVAPDESENGKRLGAYLSENARTYTQSDAFTANAFVGGLPKAAYHIETSIIDLMNNDVTANSESPLSTTTYRMNAQGYDIKVDIVPVPTVTGTKYSAAIYAKTEDGYVPVTMTDENNQTSTYGLYPTVGLLAMDLAKLQYGEDIDLSETIPPVKQSVIPWYMRSGNKVKQRQSSSYSVGQRTSTR